MQVKFSMRSFHKITHLIIQKTQLFRKQIGGMMLKLSNAPLNRLLSAVYKKWCRPQLTIFTGKSFPCYPYRQSLQPILFLYLPRCF